MKIIKKFKNLINNSINLLKAIVNSENIYWNANVKNEINSKIDNSVVIFGQHHVESVEIGFGTAIGLNSYISFTKIGKFCSIGPNLICGWGIHPIDSISTSPAFYSTKLQNGFTFSKIDKIEERKPIYIGNDVFIGANVTILDGIKIGDGAVIGAGAVVSKDIPPYAVAVGCPIKIIKYRFSPENIEKLLKIKWWDQDLDTYQLVEKNLFDIEAFMLEIETKE